MASASTPQSELTYRLYQPGDEHAILDLFEKSYGRALPMEWWRWRFANNPAGPAVIFLAWSGQTLAAHYAVSRVMLTIDGEDVPSALSGTTMTHPDFRGMGLFPELARRTYEEMARLGMKIVWGFPNANSHRGFVQDLQWRDIYEIPTLRRKLDKPLPEPAAGVDETPLDANAFASIAERTSSAEGVQVKRGADYLTWRFETNPTETYRFLRAGDDGYVAFKRYKDELQIVDLCAARAETTQQLVYRAAAIARAEEAVSIALWTPFPAATHRVLEKLGFGVDAPVTYLGALILRDLEPARVYSPFAWQFAMSDSDVY